MRALLIVLPIFVISSLTACGGGEEDSFRQGPPENTSDDQTTQDGVVITEQGAYHDAIDDTPAADPIQRDEAYMAVAKAIAAPYLTEAIGPLDYTMRFETGDYADFVVTGIFTDPSGEGEKEAYFTISRKTSEYWILDDPINPEFTNAELNYRRNLEKIEEYEGALELLNQLSATLLLAESFVESSGDYSHMLIRRFEFELGNPTGNSHEVEYTLEWDENSADPRCVGPENKSGTELVEATSTTPIEVVESKRIGLGFGGKCQDVTVANARVSITGVDDYERDNVEQQLEKLQSQTSP